MAPNDRIAIDIDELDRYLGVKEPVQSVPLAELHLSGASDKLVEAIARQLGLPIAARVSTTSQTARFTTHALSRTDESGRGVEGIAAQVGIPADLPLYGSSKLNGFVIDVLLGHQFKTARSDTAITLLAHELAHVLLYSLRHPRRDSEQFTDLVPLIVGFAECVECGRHLITSEDIGDRIRTTTITLGYLSDSEFEFARDEVARILATRRASRARALQSASQLRQRTAQALQSARDCSRLIADLDMTRRRVRPSDGQQLVAMHAPGYLSELQQAVTRYAGAAREAEQFATSLTHFSAKAIERLRQLDARCDESARSFAPVGSRIEADLALLRRNRPALTRFTDAIRSLARLLASRLRRKSRLTSA
ncbi:MAG: hypothetical protein NTY23_12265 [Chloroflexi bacterium]|nr:hypothetical protein [Chloroflexota bacterium]